MTDWIENLERLQALREAGAITGNEFDAEKAKLMERRTAEVNEATTEQSNETDFEFIEERSVFLRLVIIAVVLIAFSALFFFPFFIFSYANWIPVSVRVWNDLLIDTMLPAVLFFSMIVGLVGGFLLSALIRRIWRG